MNNLYGEDRPAHMAWQDPMSSSYDLNRCVEQENEQNKIYEASAEYWQQLCEEIITEKMKKEEDLTTQFEYETAIKICKQDDLKDRLKDRFIEFLKDKIVKLENTKSEKGKK